MRSGGVEKQNVPPGLVPRSHARPFAHNGLFGHMMLPTDEKQSVLHSVDMLGSSGSGCMSRMLVVVVVIGDR
jgi:hypothetical protein